MASRSSISHGSIGISDPTLRRAFRDELDKAGIEANAKVAEVCFKMATSGKVPAATFFWLKTRAGWREVLRQEHSGPGWRPHSEPAAYRSFY